MKKFLLFTLFIFANSFGQTATIEKLDGSIISATKVEFFHFKDRLAYWVGKEREKLDYSEIKSVSGAYFKFRIFPNVKLFKGMFVKAETKDKILAYQYYEKDSGDSPRVSDGTGKRVYNLSVKNYKASITFEHIILRVFDKQGNLLEDLDVKMGTRKGDVDERVAAYEMVKKHFSDCPNLLSELVTFTNREEDPYKMLFAFYFVQQDPSGYLFKYTECN